MNLISKLITIVIRYQLITKYNGGNYKLTSSCGAEFMALMSERQLEPMLWELKFNGKFKPEKKR